ncbi:uncharacterized protein LOC122331306 [Puntigrus tetrazona]|uniref:uncharacterized protein LOC122331306 n=1 Tax=Puntigrus tetrazona TaxID=1606681 RepID=UPI001C8A1EBA|nr:uncharacterized protein LOC122331306 [Puntigrus tetrazona]
MSSSKGPTLLWSLFHLLGDGFALPPFLPVFGKVPEFERKIRANAIETQLLFGSSEVLLLKCAATSRNLVSALLPGLKVAVEKDKSNLAIKSLEKAKEWMTEIIDKVKEMVERYDTHNGKVAACTSDVIAVKDDTEKKIEKNIQEIKNLRGEVTELQEKLKKITGEMNKIDETMAQKNQELQDCIREASRKRNRLGFFTALVPFVGPLVNAIFSSNISGDLAARIQVISNELSRLSNEKSNLRNQEWKMHVSLTDLQLKLVNMIMKYESIPDPVHLNDVQICLSRIQQILIQIRTFWETVSEMLGALKKRRLPMNTSSWIVT